MKEVKRLFRIFYDGMVSVFESGWIWLWILVAAIFDIRKGIVKIVLSSGQFLLVLLFLGGIRNIWKTKKRKRRI